MTSTEKARESDGARYRLLFEAAPDAILVVDAGGIILMNNAQAERLLEASSGELIGMSVEKLVPLAARKRHVELRTGFVRTQHSRPMGLGLSLHAVKLDGREFPVEISLSSTDDAAGKETIVVMRDVTERLVARRAQDELIRSKALTKVTQIALRERDFQSLCDRLTELLSEPLKADLTTIIHRRSVGEDFELRSAFGDSAEKIIGVQLGVDELSEEQRVPLLMGDVSESSHVVFPLLTTHGFRSVVSAPLFDHDVAVGTVTVASRQAHRFRSEDVAFVEAVTNIVSTALQRSAAEDKLIKSQRLESLGQLTGGVAHDFNNLLTVISGNLQLLEGTLDEQPAAVRSLTAAQRAANRGAALTAKLLAFARRQTLRPQSIDVAIHLRAFHELLARTLGANIKIVVHAAPDLSLALVDSGALEDALLNLAVNARDAMSGGGRLTISAENVLLGSTDAVVTANELGAGHYVRINIRDTGSGMTAETMRHVFEPFFTTKPIGKGSGLGLSMVYGFAKQSAGHVTLTSQLGEGTSIDLYLPVATNSGSQTVAKKTYHSQLGQGETILVLEDDEDVRDIAVAFLEGLGYAVIAVSNQKSAIAEVQSNPEIALLFSDVMLGDNETGPQVFKVLSGIKPTLRVLYASGYAKSALPLQLGIDHRREFLRKPYSRDQLAIAIEKAMARLVSG
jgi:PAS domain S-box-containing protein